MSIEAMNYVDQKVDPEMPSGMYFVLMRLADRGNDHSGEDWTCYPSIEDVCKKTHLSRSAVERHLQGLVLEGWISRKRRIRADGRKGIFDYWIHRDPARRAALKAARAAIIRAGDKITERLADLDSPHVKMQHGPGGEMQHGPCGDLDGTMLQNGPEPCGESPQLEPPLEPSGEPASRAREPGDGRFDELWEVWPDTGRKRTKLGEARAAWAWACDQEPAEKLLAAAKACAEDPAVARGDWGWPSLQSWLSEERWRAWLAADKAARSKAAAATPPPRPDFPDFAGPADVLALVGELIGADQAGQLLRGCTWREADRTIVTCTKWLRGKVEAVLPFDWRRRNAIRVQFETPGVRA